MVAAQTHRGPDDEGFHAPAVPHGSLALGHRRLSIQDLSAAGHQPMEDPETGSWIVFNGEIYNYPELREELRSRGAAFRSHCDTEAILHAYRLWGPDAFRRLHGMFALGLFDNREKRLVLARDGLGIKPLYYAWGPDAFVFASELRAVAASGLVDRTIDRRALAGLLAYGAVVGPLTMLRSVRLLEPGTWAALDLTASSFEGRRLREARYWEFPDPRGGDAAGRPAADEFRHVVASSVRSHLISDVPVGVFLSSGIDSTAVAMLCAEARGGDLDTFTVALAGEPEIDEGPLARRTAQALGARHHEIELTEEKTRRLAEAWLGCLDQPSVDGLNTYIISHEVRQRGIIVALSGLGGDEVFAGYSTFREVPRLLRIARAARTVPRGLRVQAARLLCRRGTRAQRLKAVEIAGTAATLPSLYFRRRRLMSDAELFALGFDAAELGLDANFLPPESEPERGTIPGDPTSSVGVLESRFYMGNMLLRDSDVFGMAHGLEIRVPLLDRRIADPMYATAGSARIAPQGPNKHRLVEALPAGLRPELLHQKKRGFTLPFTRWMVGPLRERFEGLVATTSRSGLVDPAGVEAIWRGFLEEGPRASWSRAWMLGSLGAWLSRAMPSGISGARVPLEPAPGDMGNVA